MSAALPTVPITLHARSARDMMTATPEAIYDTAPVSQAASLLVRFSAVPVIDHDRRIVGVLSRTDLVRERGQRASPAEVEIPVEDEAAASGVEYHPERRVAEVMNPAFHAVDVDATAADVIRLMVDQEIGRVFVLDERRLLTGVISSSDVLARLRC